MMMFYGLMIPTKASHAIHKQHKPARASKLDRLRTLIHAGEHLRNPSKGLSSANLKTQRELALMVGLQSHRNVSRLIRREFPEVAAVMDARQWNPKQDAPKKGRFLWYIEKGCHLRDPEGEPTADNVKSQQKIAEELGMTQPTISVYMREYFPDIAAVMTKRKGRYRGKQAKDRT